MKTLHIINDLRRSGAEVALARLAEQSHDAGDHVSIICLKGEGDLAQPLREKGIRVDAVGIGVGPRLPLQLFNLVRLIRQHNPEVVQTWLYHSNLLGGVASRIARPRTPVIWGIHHSILHRDSSKRTTRLVSWALARLSRVVPARIIYCASKSRQSHEAAGYDRRRGVVIPNGISISQFRPEPTARERIRKELGVANDARVIGIVARFHPDKDIPTFVKAAGILAASMPDVHFVLAGGGLDSENADLVTLVEATGSAGRFHLIGPRNDVAAVLNAFDLASLSSITEALPVSIIEAMATGVPCVATDVGDTAEVIDRTGRTVPASNPEALAAAWSELLSLDSGLFTALGVAARDRVTQHYRLEVTTDRYRSIYRDAIAS